MLKIEFCAAAVFAALVATAARGGEEKSVLPRSDNAAILYLEGAATRAVPQSAGELEALKFMDEEFGKLPPAALSDRPDAVALLSRDLDSDGAMSLLHDGAQRGPCAFDLNWDAGPDMEMPHLGLLRLFAFRCVAAAKCAEFRGDPVRAAEICGDLARMGAHVGREPVLMSGLVAALIQNVAASEAEGLLSRSPGRESVEKLLRALQSLPEPLRMDSYCRVDAEFWGEWVIRKAQAPEKELMDFIRDYLHGEGPPSKMATHELEGLKEPEIRARILEWARGYQQHMRRLARNVAGPYHEAAPAITDEERGLNNTILEMTSRELQGDRDLGNPLLQIFVPALTVSALPSLANAEARIGMMRVLCAAMLLKEETGSYPANLEELRRYFPDGFPKDPFTGKDYTLSMSGGLPAVSCGAPEEVRKKSPNDFSFDLARQRRLDAEALKNFRGHAR
ncbi:MAG: hypothetical protein ABSA67_14480 [Candidatus Brocadiia bacterium]|jgi:hypothetical protein